MTDGTALLVGGSSEIGIAVLTELLGPPPRRVVLAGRPSSELWWNAEKLRDLGYSVTTAQYDATIAHYLMDQLSGCNVTVSRLAHGVPIGGELDYLDDGTLAAAVKARKVM